MSNELTLLILFAALYLALLVENRGMFKNEKAEGWTYLGCHPYERVHRYEKKIDIRDELEGIVFSFTKRSSEEEMKTLGFKDEVMAGSYMYPIPKDLNEEIAKAVHSNNVSQVLIQKLRLRFEENVISDEYNELVRLQKDLQKAASSKKKHESYKKMAEKICSKHEMFLVAE
ncbi:hypothetical protein [Butyrivibrio proteoclasticus]|uniref:hypothetical protein n=1 Tax=Butyrivibrio proteoclasticus TaxID=43305 RepID=UPI00047C144C|nr:hypothetical protein [Butyrivibrio proteoclasticus]